MPGPRPTPTHLRLLKVNPSHRSINCNEPQPPIPPEPPEPPAFLSPTAKDEWWRIAGELHNLGLLTLLDVMPLAAYCAAAGRFADAERMLGEMAECDPVTGGLLIKAGTGTPMLNPILSVAYRSASDMVRFSGEFGLSPAARTRIRSSVAGQVAPSKFGNLLGG